jgi:UDP-N-acetylglucosamine 3-dehydrogenase
MGRSLAKALQSLETARLAGVADVNEEAARQAGAEFDAPGYASAEELLDNSDVEAVIIASPGYLHRPLAELAAARGRAIFVEKPMATSASDCDAMIDAAEQARVLLMVGQVLRYYPCWWQILKMVRDGEIGQPLGITVTRIGGRFSGTWERTWRHSVAMSGGLLMEVNAHEIDFMCQVGGDVTRVYAEADHYLDDPGDYPNLCLVSMRFASGAVGMLHSSSVSALGDLSGKVQGSEGTIIYSRGMGGGGEIRFARHKGEPQVIRIDEIQVEPPVRHELRLFIEAVQNEQASPIPGAEGRRNVAIAEAAHESARAGRPVDIATP